MKTPTDAALLLAPALMLAWLAWDLLVVSPVGRRKGWPTITHRTIELSRAYPAIPFLSGLILGLLAGHLFGQF